MRDDVWARFALSGPLLEQRRRTLRLAGYDYSQAGAYFVTLCTHDRECFFGDITEGVMLQNAYGRIVEEEWQRTAVIRPEVLLDDFIVMPNHFHAIVIFGTAAESPTSAPVPASDTLRRAPRSLGSLLGAFKGAVTRRVSAERHTPGLTVWQRNYHERIIHTEDHMNKARLYIASNPSRWVQDVNNPANIPLPHDGEISV